jgi:hypothetical protein
MKTFPIVFASTFVVIGLGICIFGVVYLRKARATLNWPTTEGKVVRSRVVSWFDSDGDTIYGAQVEYRYTVAGTDYLGQRVHMGMTNSSSSAPHEKIVGRYGRGETVIVAYHPQDPSDAVLEPGVPISVYVPLAVGLLMSGLAGGMLYSLLTSEWV